MLEAEWFRTRKTIRQRFTGFRNKSASNELFRKRGSKVTGELFKRTKSQFKTVQKQVDFKQLEKGIFGSFSRNPIGTLVGVGMLFLSLFWLGSGVGPINNSTIANDFTVMYNNTSWLGLITFALVFPTSIGLALIRKPPQPVMVQPEELEESQESSIT